jgi:O-antigen/teichoic acid export membrane protein
VFKDTTLAIVSRGLTLVLALLITTLVARSLGPALKGTYEIAVLIVRTSFILTIFGLDAANVFLGAREPQKLPIFIGNSILAALILSGIVILILETLLTLSPTQAYLAKNGINISWMHWLVTLIPLMLIHLYLQEIIHAAGQMLIYTSLSIIQFIIQLLLLVGFIIFPTYLLEVAILSWVFSQIFITFITLFFALHTTGFKVAFDFQTFKESLAFGIQLHPGNIAQYLNYRLDIFLVGIFLTPAAVGIYATATLLAERLWDIPTSIRTALTFHLSSRPDAAAILTARTCRMIVIITTPIYIAVFLLANFGIRLLFGEDFLPTVQPLILLLPGIWTLSLGKILVTYLSSIGRPIVGTWSALISLVVTLLLDTLLIPRIGIAGAAITSSISYTIAAFVIGYNFIQHTKLTITELIVPQKEDWVSLKQLAAKVTNLLKKRHTPRSS